MATSTTESTTDPNILSTTNGETAFFRSIIRYRPRGYNRHFSMAGICKDLERELQIVIPSDQIWRALSLSYNLDVLAEMEPDDPHEIDRSKSTFELLTSKLSSFQEFQLPIHPSLPEDFSFLELIDERRLETSNPSPPSSPPPVHSPRRRTTLNSSLKLNHPDRPGHNRSSTKHHAHDPSSVKPATDESVQEGMESDLTEQEDDEDEKEEEEEEPDKEDEEDEEEQPSTSEPRNKRLKTSRPHLDSLSGSTSRARSSTGSTKNPPSSARPNRSRTRTRWKR